MKREHAGKKTAGSEQGRPQYLLQLANAKAPLPMVVVQDIFTRAELNAGDHAQDGDTHWRLLDRGEWIKGWVCEKNHPKTEWKSPWEWPCFELVDNTGITKLDLLKRHLYVMGQLMDGETDGYEPEVVKVNKEELVEKLEKAIGYQGDSDGTARELAHALAKRLSRIAVQYESEWGKLESEKWNCKGLVGFIKGNQSLRKAAMDKNWQISASNCNRKSYEAFNKKLEAAYNAFK